MFRLAILIDGAYLDHIGMNADVRVDCEKLANEIYLRVAARTPTGIDLLRSYYYNSLPHRSNPPTAEEQQRYDSRYRFFDALRYLPSFTVRLGVVKVRGNDGQGQPIFEQKQVDLLMGLDLALLSAKRSITHAAVVTGDGDMVPAFQAAQREGIAVWCFTDETLGSAQELWRAADERVPIDGDFLQAIRRMK
ncbi:MAG: NYN domain-containing protein [Anaerolineaceae bacterium]|nr:NYN domain-containing protein [Anaerolineaceae bacterium]